MWIAIFCLCLLAGHAQASTYSYNCVVDGTLTVSGKQILPLLAGSGIQLTNNGTANIVSMNDTTLSSAGGISLVGNGAGPALSILGLSAGSGIKLYSNPTNVSISSDVNLTSTGGVSLVSNGVGPSLSILGLSPGSGVSLTSNGVNVTISSTQSGTVSNLSSAGGSVPLVSNGAGPSLSILGLSQGNGIKLTASPTDVTIASTTSTFFAKANIAIPANTATNVFAFTPTVSTSYGIQFSLYGNLGTNALNVNVFAEGTGSSSAGTIGCGQFNRFGTGGSSNAANTLAPTPFNINTAQTVATSVANSGMGIFLINCYYTTSANSYTTLRVQLQSSTAATLYVGSSMIITATPLTN